MARTFSMVAAAATLAAAAASTAVAAACTVPAGVAVVQAEAGALPADGWSTTTTAGALGIVWKSDQADPARDEPGSGVRTYSMTAAVAGRHRLVLRASGEKKWAHNEYVGGDRRAGQLGGSQGGTPNMQCFREARDRGHATDLLFHWWLLASLRHFACIDWLVDASSASLSTSALAQGGCTRKGGCKNSRRPSGCTSTRTAATVWYVVFRHLDEGGDVRSCSRERLRCAVTGTRVLKLTAVFSPLVA